MVSSTVWCITPIASRCAESPCAKNAIHHRMKTRNESLSTSRKQGQRGCRPFPLHPKSPLNRSSASLRTLSVDDAEHFLHNHYASVASLRLLFTFAPECRSASLRNRCLPSPEYPGWGDFSQNCLHDMRIVGNIRVSGHDRVSDQRGEPGGSASPF